MELSTILFTVGLTYVVNFDHFFNFNNAKLAKNPPECFLIQIIIRIFAAENLKRKKIMASAATIPMEGQILVNIEDMSMLKDIKKAISLLKGVGKITIPRRKRYSAYELSLRDLDEGRVYKYDSLGDLIKEIEG